MQSTTMFNNGSIVSKIEFHGIKSVYPVGERVQCFFTLPEFRKPECGDWIGIYPVGWSNMHRDCLARQMVRVEQLNGQYGQVEFESMPQMPTTIGQYQFVYVSASGEYVVLGASSPFRFGGEHEFSLYQQPEQRFAPATKTTTFATSGSIGSEWFTGPSRFTGVESEIQKLQHEIVGLEQGLWQQQQQYQTPSQIVAPFGGVTTWTTATSGKGVWQPKMVKIEQILREKVRIEQAQRRLDQLCLLAHIKSCERHVVNVQKREPEIHSFLLKNKMQTKIALFEQKVNQVVKMNGPSATTTLGPVEQYVRRYEQLLREKIQLDMEKRRIQLQKLRLTIRECERKLRDLQTVDQEYLVSFHQSLKTKLGQFAAIVQDYELTQHGVKHFETVMGPFLFEQEKKTLGLFQTQRELQFLINEISGKLQELEFESGLYTQLRIPRISTGLMFNSHPKLAEIVQLEKKIAEQKLKLKLSMLTGLNSNGGVVPTRFLEQLSRGQWFGPVVEYLRQIQLHLAKFNTTTTTTGFPLRGQNARVWAEKKSSVVTQFVQLFAQFQAEAMQVTGGPQQSLFGLFEHIKTRQVLGQLRELKERECMEIIRFFQENTIPTYGQSPVVVEQVQQLIELIGEKMSELSAFTQWYQPQYQQSTMPVDWLLAATWGAELQQQQHTFVPSLSFIGSAGCSPAAMLELFEIERKLVEMKSHALHSIHYMHLSERLVELEQFVHQIEAVHKRERLVEQIRSLKRMVQEHVQQYQPSFVTIPEQFYVHQQKYEKMCQLIGEVECHFIEQVTGMPIQSSIQFGGEFQSQQQQPRFYGLTLVHQFFRLVQEFQTTFPEMFSEKIEEIKQYLRSVENVVVTTGFSHRQGQPIFGQELKEKLVEFETILCQPECEIACLTTSLFPQSSSLTMKAQRECLKHLIRHVRDLKFQVQLYLTTLVQQPTIQQQYVPVEESQLINMLNKNLWINNKNNVSYGVRVPHTKTSSTVVESSTTSTTTSSSINGPLGGGNKTTIVKSISMPVSGGCGLMKPISIENVIRGSEELQEIVGEEEQRIVFPGAQQQQYLNKVRFGGAFDLVEEYDEEEEEDFDFGTDAEITISTLLNNCQSQQQQQPGMIKLENIINGTDYNNNTTGKYLFGGEQQRFFSPESCLCQIEKHIRKTGNIECPLCTVQTTTTTTTGVVRKF